MNKNRKFNSVDEVGDCLNRVDRNLQAVTKRAERYSEGIKKEINDLKAAIDDLRERIKKLESDTD